ncbi:DUF7473 family protein [Halapricum desulfuricans]|uniref:Putative membrane protein n=1 Tax=Halapricum desulfuricans TaxID=2841257 RepID=A0A897N6I3_9EURY|nr:hypothetical protein [Halapricum desulfuricans]QSG06665.1 putative membrane protein [Halapricum desulfuricans]
MRVLVSNAVAASALTELSSTVASASPVDASVLQASPGRGLVALLAAFVVATLFYAVTLHLAATFFLGTVPTQKAATVAPAPALVSVLLGRYGLERVAFISQELGVLIVVVTTLSADAFVISRVYDLDAVPTAILTLLHFAFAAVLGIALANLFGLS